MKRLKSWAFWCVLVLSVVIFSQQAFAFVVEDYTKLIADDAFAGDQYGFCVDTDGRWLVVGAKSATVDGLQSGAVYVYFREGHRGGWKFYQKLVPENLDGILKAEFGESVAVSRNRILVGARSMSNESDAQSGTAFLYVYRGRKLGWVLETEVMPADGRDDDEFGRSVALGPQRLFVGARYAHNDADPTVSTGAVYVYRKFRGSWTQETKLLDPNGTAGDQFGRAISFDQKRYKYLVVGSRKASDGKGDQGKVTIFRTEGRGWSLHQQIEAFDGADTDYFGQSVALSEDLLVVGARDSKDDEGNKVGAAYIYRLSEENGEWLFEQKLMPEEGQDKGQYGFSVDFDRLTGTSLAVGARRMDSGDVSETGLVYLYSFDDDLQEFQLDDIIVPEDAAAEDEFGQSLTMDPFGGNWLIVGADQVSVSGQKKAGAVYMLNSGDNKPYRRK